MSIRKRLQLVRVRSHAFRNRYRKFSEYHWLLWVCSRNVRIDFGKAYLECELVNRSN